MDTESLVAEDHLRNILRTRTIAVGAAETHRQFIESNLRNALYFGGYEGEASKRLERLLVSIEGVAAASPQRKVDVITWTVIPVVEQLVS